MIHCHPFPLQFFRRQRGAEIAVIPFHRIQRLSRCLVFQPPVRGLVPQSVYNRLVLLSQYLLGSFRNPPSVIPDCAAAWFCVSCPSSTLCDTFRRTRSLSLNASRSCFSANIHWLICFKQELSTLLY